jgi:hypothetical protein
MRIVGNSQQRTFAPLLPWTGFFTASCEQKE